MKIIVVDIEATCWRKNPPPGEQNEIIEVGVCLLDTETLTPSHKKSILVKPTRSKVSDFCTKLTTLTQEQVDTGISFAEACAMLEKEYESKAHIWVSWGNYDRKMFESQCISFGVPYPFHEQHINLKELHGTVMNKGQKMGMARAVKSVGLELIGTHHRGDDDAWNIARVLAVMLEAHGQGILEQS